jgi:hypothetical protein
LPFLWGVCLGAIAAILSCVYSLRVLSAFVSWDQIPRPLQKLLARFRPVFTR